MNFSISSQQPIGVFDSGIGGLTVVAALRRHLPHEDIIYLGDTARVPYGGKSQETITRYSKEITNLLLEKEAKMIVIACNTASALALPELKNFYHIPIQDVIVPGALAAIKATRQNRIGVIGTKATIASNAYSNAIKHLKPTCEVFSMACPLLVPLVEEGLFEDEITDNILHRYLDSLLAKKIDTLVLGCTHYPLLKKRISAIVGPDIVLVDSAVQCTLAVQSLLALNTPTNPQKESGLLEVMLTDSSESFLHLAAEALNLKINRLSQVKLQ